MHDPLKDIETRLSKCENILEKIDLQNKFSWELRVNNIRQTLILAEEAYGAAVQIKHLNGMAESLRIQSFAHQVLENYDLSFQKAIEALGVYRKTENREGEDSILSFMFETLKKESEVHRISNEKLKKLNEEIKEKNRSILESIDYAKHIQESILPHSSSLKQYFNDSFVFFRPKDIISGDFFWLFEKENEILVAAVDCTGHGVSGALMSVVVNSILNQVTLNQWLPNPSFILNEVNHYLQRTLATHDDSGLRDSMDIAICSINKSKADLLFAGAHNSLYIVSEGNLTEYKGDAISIGNSASVKFSNHKVKIKKGDCLYIFTDGFADQKGGPHRKKFYYEPFRDLLLKNHTQSMVKQKIQLNIAMDEWMGENEQQIDDMLIVGIRI